jgi:hypothetical protein
MDEETDSKGTLPECTASDPDDRRVRAGQGPRTNPFVWT